MPLIKSASNQAREENIKEMISSGHPPNVAVAASYHNQRDVESHKHEHEMHRYGRKMPY